MALKVLYRLRKKPSKETGLKQLFMLSPSKWTTTGRYFTTEQLIKILRDFHQTLSGIETFPSDWEIVEYQLVETKTLQPDGFVKYKAKHPFVREI